MQQPLGFAVAEGECEVSFLKNPIHGIRLSPRAGLTNSVVCFLNLDSIELPLITHFLSNSRIKSSI